MEAFSSSDEAPCAFAALIAARSTFARVPAGPFSIEMLTPNRPFDCEKLTRTEPPLASTSPTVLPAT